MQPTDRQSMSLQCSFIHVSRFKVFSFRLSTKRRVDDFERFATEGFPKRRRLIDPSNNQCIYIYIYFCQVCSDFERDRITSRGKNKSRKKNNDANNNFILFIRCCHHKKTEKWKKEKRLEMTKCQKRERRHHHNISRPRLLIALIIRSSTRLTKGTSHKVRAMPLSSVFVLPAVYLCASLCLSLVCAAFIFLCRGKGYVD